MSCPDCGNNENLERPRGMGSYWIICSKCGFKGYESLTPNDHSRKEPEKVHEFPFAKYYEGVFEVFGNKEGLPKINGVIPAPDVNHPTEESREKTYCEACNQIILQGYLITSKRRIRNTAFDKPNQKTTLKLIYRPCKNDAEIKTVAKQINAILNGVPTEDELNRDAYENDKESSWELR